jgi:hypothetical protein
MIIEKSNGNGELEIFSYKMAGYDGDIKIFQDGKSKNIRFLVCAEQNVCKQDNQASALVE